MSSSAYSSTCKTTCARCDKNRSGNAAIASRAIASISSAVGGWSKRRAIAWRHRGEYLPAASLPPRATHSTWPASRRLVMHPIHARCSTRRTIGIPCGAVAEWSKALAWKVSIRQNRIEGSNPSRSAIYRLDAQLSTLPNLMSLTRSPGRRGSLSSRSLSIRNCSSGRSATIAAAMRCGVSPSRTVTTSITRG